MVYAKIFTGHLCNACTVLPNFRNFILGLSHWQLYRHSSCVRKQQLQSGKTGNLQNKSAIGREFRISHFLSFTVKLQNITTGRG